MSKYEPLLSFLQGATAHELPMRFEEIEGIIAAPLPPVARRHRAWWSNNASNSVMTKAWLGAGFRTERVDMAGERLVFRRIDGAGDERHAPAPTGRHPLFGAMRGTFTIAPGVDLTEPADPEWGKVYAE